MGRGQRSMYSTYRRGNAVTRSTQYYSKRRSTKQHPNIYRTVGTLIKFLSSNKSVNHLSLMLKLGWASSMRTKHVRKFSLLSSK